MKGGDGAIFIDEGADHLDSYEVTGTKAEVGGGVYSGGYQITHGTGNDPKKQKRSEGTFAAIADGATGSVDYYGENGETKVDGKVKMSSDGTISGKGNTRIKGRQRLWGQGLCHRRQRARPEHRRRRRRGWHDEARFDRRLLTADVAARSIAAAREVPVGVMTALLGGPLILWLIRKGRIGAGA